MHKRTETRQLNGRLTPPEMLHALSGYRDILIELVKQGDVSQAAGQAGNLDYFLRQHRFSAGDLRDPSEANGLGNFLVALREMHRYGFREKIPESLNQFALNFVEVMEHYDVAQKIIARQIGEN